MIILYQKTCEGCSGNLSVMTIKAYCKNEGVEFEERLTPLWTGWKEEAKTIEDTLGIKQPFFYSTNSRTAVTATSFTDSDSLKSIVKADKQES